MSYQVEPIEFVVELLGLDSVGQMDLGQVAHQIADVPLMPTQA
jgi:hypothetical protein